MSVTRLTFALVVVVGGLGGGHFDHTTGFSGTAITRRRAPPPFFAYHLIHQFRTPPENFSPRWCQVRSPGKVKWPYLKKYLGFRHDYSFWDINMKLSGIDEGISTYKTYISRFWFQWPEVRSVLRPHHYKAKEKMVICRFFLKYEWERAIYLKIFLH